VIAVVATVFVVAAWCGALVFAAWFVRGARGRRRD